MYGKILQWLEDGLDDLTGLSLRCNFYNWLIHTLEFRHLDSFLVCLANYFL